MVDDEFSDIPGALAVHGDIIVSGATTEEHDTALEEVLKRARERNIKFNKKKVQLRVTEVKYLGNIVSAKRFTPDPEKIRAIIEMPPPESKQDLRRLLGMVNYLSQYIPGQHVRNHSTTARPSQERRTMVLAQRTPKIT